MKFRLLQILALFIFVHTTYSQVVLQSEDWKNGKYVLSFETAASGVVLSHQGKNYIYDHTMIEDDYIEPLPSRSVFVSLPPESKPLIDVISNKSDFISTHEISNRELLRSEFFSVKGYLWIENNYCVNISINPIYRDPITENIVIVKEFRVEIDLPSSAQNVHNISYTPINPAIENQLYGKQWQSLKPNYSIFQSDSWIDYSSEYLKLGVVRDGIYRLYYSDMLSFGVPVATINPRSIKMFLKGKEIPLFVYGESDNSFDHGDYIEFIGRRNYGDANYRAAAQFGAHYNEYLNIYSDTTIYWINWTGVFGQRIDTVVSVDTTPIDTLQYFDMLLHVERNITWDFSLNPNNLTAELRKNFPELLENETWYDGNMVVGKYSEQFTVTDLFPNKPARAFAKLQSFSSSVDQNAHNLALSINSFAARYDSGFINKYQVKTLTANFSSSQLFNGINTLGIHSFTTSNTVNVVARDWTELEYPRFLKAINDSLSISYSTIPTPKPSLVLITGITTGNISLYKYNTIDSNYTKITNYILTNDTLKFVDTVSNNTQYYILRDNKIPSPILFYKKVFTNLRNPSNRADYIAITHPYFQSVVASYVSFIASSYNIIAKYVDITDIYDEFNYGFLAPEPIKDFLISAHNYWQQPKPKYVTLIGKGTYDYYGNKTKYIGAPRIANFIPVWGNPISDIWFVQWDTTGSLIPQMNIGRLPVNNINEFQAYYLKHQKFISKGFDDWNKRYMFFSGGNFSDPNQIAQSKGTNDFIINNYVTKKPIGGTAINFYKTANPITNFGPYSQEYIADQIDRGGVFISYIGHSGTQTWDNSITDIVQLANSRDRNPMISDFGCSTGKFAEPDVFSFSELAVTSLQGQAISYIGNSSLGFTSTAYSFPRTFYKKLLVDTTASLGDVHRLSKIDYIKQYGSSNSFGLFIKTNTLIGDPIVQLPIPTKSNMTFSNVALRLTPELPTEQTDTIFASVKYFNLGSVQNDSITLTIKIEYNGTAYYQMNMKRIVPLYVDSVDFIFPVKGNPGEHTITVTIDPENRVSEIYENDNVFVQKILVASSSIRNLSPSINENQTNGNILFLNPSVAPLQTQFTVEVSLQPQFNQIQNYTLPYAPFYTEFILDPSFQEKRIWLRTKYDDTNLEGLTVSYYFGSKDNILFNDEESFFNIIKDKIQFQGNSLILDSTVVHISALSGGFNDGKTAVISKNGQNYIPESTKRAHHVCLFDATTYEFKSYHQFDVLAGGTAIMTQYAQLLDTLSQDYIVAIAICDEGGLNLSTALKNAIKSIGSVYIDSVQFRYSWAIIGRKGASPGTVKEKFTRLFEGQVTLDTTFYLPTENGSFSTNIIGPVAEWKNIELTYTEQKHGHITMNAIGIKADATEDTIKQWDVIDSVLDLSTINANIYPSIRLAGRMNRNTGEISPSISSIGINFYGLAELGTNYQTVRCFVQKNGNPRKEIQPGDTVLQGEKVDIVYRVYNVGGVPVKNVGVILTSQWDNNSIEQLSSVAIDSLGIRSYKEFTVPYNTSLGFGRRNIQVSIDPDTTVRELYRDNNLFVFPLVVKKNQTSPLLPNLTITAGGIRPSLQRITNEIDSVRFTIVYANTGALVNDSISIAVRHAYRGTPATEWLIRRKYPPSTDTISIDVPILKRSGEHSLSVELDQVGLIAESNESDNDATYFFTVFTTDFRIIQPAGISIAATERMIFLNPTSIENALPAIAYLEIDTVVNFTAPLSLQSPMTEFISEFPIASLAKNKRFYWRIKQQNSQRDWTTGSFYRGDSSSFALGQVDSAGWMSNSFLRTSYDKQNGARIVDTKFAFKAISAGFSDGLNGSVELNGVNISAPIIGPGHNITVLDTINFSVKKQRRFDVSNNADEVDSLIVYLSSITSGDLVINVVVDDGANNMTVPARNAFKSIGSASIDNLAFRDSWAIIGTKGSAIGTALESYKPQGTGAAVIETTIMRKENSGRIVTQQFPTGGKLSTMQIDAQIPAGVRSSAFRTAITQSVAELTTRIVGITEENVHDTVITVINQQSIPLQNFPVMHYPEMKIVFDLKSNAAFESPALQQWTISGTPPLELATSPAGVSISKLQVMEGETIEYRGSVYNLGGVAAESVLVRINTLHSGLETTLKEERLAVIAVQETSAVTATFDSKGKKGSLAFRMVIDPLNEKVEVSKENNSVTIPFTITADSVRPLIAVTVDGRQIVNGDYIGQYPVIMIRYSDNNPTILTPADTTLFRIRLNNQFVPFTAGTAELTTTTSPGAAEVRWTPALKDGENIIQIFANDVTGMSSDTVTMFVNVASQFKLLDVYNIPNPFGTSTHFTFNLAGPVLPEEVTIKIYTVAGRLIHEITSPAIIGFNKINWDGRDKDGDAIGNGVYLYRVILKHHEKQVTATSKLVKMR